MCPFVLSQNVMAFFLVINSTFNDNDGCVTDQCLTIGILITMDLSLQLRRHYLWSLLFTHLPSTLKEKFVICQLVLGDS